MKTGRCAVRRLVLSLSVALVLVVAPSAAAWTWPLGGSLLRPYSLGSDPYAAGMHRGVDTAGEAGEAVLAPADGTVSFAGTVPVHGRTVTIQTPDGYAVSLTHLGEIAVARGDVVAEGARIGVAGASGTSEWPVPYVHLGIRIAASADGYVDPLTLLPPLAVAATPPAQPVSTEPVVTQPVVTQPVSTQPVSTQPVVTQPVSTQPVVTQPVSGQPGAGQPVLGQPAPPQPVSFPAPNEPPAPPVAPSVSIPVVQASRAARTFPAPGQVGPTRVAPVRVGGPIAPPRDPLIFATAPFSALAHTTGEPRVARSGAVSAGSLVRQADLPARAPGFARDASPSRTVRAGVTGSSGGRSSAKDRGAPVPPVYLHAASAERAGGGSGLSGRVARPGPSAAASALPRAVPGSPARVQRAGATAPGPEVHSSQGSVPASPPGHLRPVGRVRVPGGTPEARGAWITWSALPLMAGAVAIVVAMGIAVGPRGRRNAARMMASDGDPSKDPGGGGLAVRERPTSHRARGGLRRPVRHLRALSPAARERCLDGERNGRTRDADHGRGGSRRTLSA